LCGSEPMINFDERMRQARFRVSEFAKLCFSRDGMSRLTPNAEPTLFALCFYIFLANLLRESFSATQVDVMSRMIRDGIRSERKKFSVVPMDKPYRQLLCFSLSALKILGSLENDTLDDLVLEQIDKPISDQLEAYGCLTGAPGAGNQAMFVAIFLIHCRDYLQVDTQSLIDEWVQKHLDAMNRFGFWGPNRGMTHLQFQNGYHQYEIFDYLRVKTKRMKSAAYQTLSLCDAAGHFAPYPGGGGCFDYDAVTILTRGEGKLDEEVTNILLTLADSILSGQQDDGGFAESLMVRPRSIEHFSLFISQIMSAIGNWPLFIERTRYAISLQRIKHNRITTHWSHYSRAWGESNLWDSWFRMSSLARIEIALDSRAIKTWGFIDYPGIGYHPLLGSPL